MQKKYRVKKEREFQKVFEEGASFANRKFVVYRLEPSGQKHFRVGLSVGTKSSKTTNSSSFARIEN